MGNRGSKVGPGEEYVVSTNDPEINKNGHFPSNYIRTAKYTLLTFLPLNLYQQFKHFSNIYFFLVACISLGPSTPVTPVSSVMPLVIVLAATAIKDAFEDYRRYQEDKKANSAAFKRLTEDGELEDVISEHIHTGDIIYVTTGQIFPADLVQLKTSDPDGLAFIETSNLDGESNLKRRSAPKGTLALSPRKLAQLETQIHCELPNANLYHFQGRLELQSGATPLTERHFLQRGATLRNTEYVYGAVVYAGTDTKLFKNLENVIYKVSPLRRTLDRAVMGLFVFKMILVIIATFLSGDWHAREGQDAFYLDWDESPAAVGGLHFLTYFLLGSFIIPISLFVTIELCRLFQSMFMYVDPQMAGMRARNSQTHESLGMIQHIFSDKTGTFTRNEMRLTRLSIGDQTYYEDEDPGQALSKSAESDDDDRVLEMLRAITLCNTVVPEWVTHNDEDSQEESRYSEDETQSELKSMSGKDLVFQADSPDEVALLECAQANGHTFMQRKADSLLVEEDGEIVEHELLATLEFTPVRKRMSVIVRTPDDTIRLYMKGADNEVMKRCDDDDKLYDSIDEQVVQFASEGFRTLVFAYRDIDEDEFEEWKDRFDEAEGDIKNRAELVAKACEEMEEDLTLMGCTAVEDRLQDQVPDSIHYFFQSNIKVWLLTGDKQETAINIGYSSRLILPSFDLIIINQDSTDEVRDELRRAIETHRGTSESFAVVLNGTALRHALADHAELFISLGDLENCGGVICCRTTPLQKALVVRYAKQYLSSVSLSIGDGSNDVAMIQEADVGVGILGREGSQAARASDYAITEFKHLRHLISVHGRYSYLRLAGLIQYSFYKNVAFILPQFYFGFYSGWSGQVYYDEWVLSTFNLFMTALAPFMYGFIEKDISRKNIDSYPQAYIRLQKQPLFTKKTFIVWMINAVWHSFVFFFGVKWSGVGGGVFTGDGQTEGMWGQAVLAQQVGILTVIFKMAIFHRQWNLLTVFSIGLSILWYFFFMTVYSTMQSFQPSMFHVFYNVMGESSMWIAWFGITAIALLPDIAVKYYQGMYYPQDWQILNEIEKFNLAPVFDPRLEDNDGMRYRYAHGEDSSSKVRRVSSFPADMSATYSSTDDYSSAYGSTTATTTETSDSDAYSSSESTSLSDSSSSGSLASSSEESSSS